MPAWTSVKSTLLVGPRSARKIAERRAEPSTMASSTNPPGLSMIQAARDYIARMVTDVAGMKVLVMDTETTGIVSIVYTKTQIRQVAAVPALRGCRAARALFHCHTRTRSHRARLRLPLGSATRTAPRSHSFCSTRFF